MCDYFEADDELRPLKPKLLGNYTATELAYVLFAIWKTADESQFTWFVGCFEKKMQLMNVQYFDDAHTKFTELCDTCEL